MTKKLNFEEVTKRVNEFNPSYELIEYINCDSIILKYIPTEEEFKCSLRNFLRGKAHAPSIAKKVWSEKVKKTNLERYGVENPAQNKEVQDKVKKLI